MLVRGFAPMLKKGAAFPREWERLAVYFVYMLASKNRVHLYTDQTNDLCNRIEQHRAKAVDAWTAEHETDRLVYFEMHDTLRDSLVREQKLKRWRRAWKENLIESINPEWRDLTDEIPL